MIAGAAIVGVGESSIGRVPGRSALDLTAQAMDDALASAGLEREAIDGLITLPVLTEGWMMPAAHVARGLGLSPRYLSTVDLAGAGGAPRSIKPQGRSPPAAPKPSCASPPTRC